MPNLQQKVQNLPQKPGVYLFKDKTGRIIYIGKAKNLRSRVKQYFQAHDERPQIPYLLKDLADLDITITHNELESLYLENSLIKQYLPKYNIELRDDKNYAFIKIDYSTQIPQIMMARKIDEPASYKLKAKSYCFGPYSAAHKIKNTLRLVRKIFPFCSAAKVSSKPCFYYHLHRCPGVCIGKISLAEYQNQLKKISWFLAGNTAKAKGKIKKEMLAASRGKKFEAAARYRDQLRALELLEEKQTAILNKKVDWDIIALFTEGHLACVNLFKIRGGKLLDKENFVYQFHNSSLPPLILRGGKPDVLSFKIKKEQSEVLQTFLEKYYLEASSLPQSIFLQTQIENEQLIKKLLARRQKKKTGIFVPQKGRAKQLIKLGQTNAREYLKNYSLSQAENLDRVKATLEQLKQVLQLPKIPRRIEGYDISNLQGTNPVGSMVVFLDGLPAKSQYRKFKIQGKTTPDDFLMMQEMLSRRFLRTPPCPLFKKRGGEKEKISPSLQKRGQGEFWPLPDLIVIDGGKGQLSAALQALKNSKFEIRNSKFLPVIGLAKRIEEIFLPGKKQPLTLPRNNQALQLLQRLRDEAHRFGITFHRQLRSKQAVKSALDNIPGLGPKTKKLLKAKFGTVAEIKTADAAELKKLVGKKLAATIKKLL